MKNSKINIKEVSKIDSLLSICGIGKPESFDNSLKSLDIKPLKSLTFPDHHNFNKKDIDSLVRKIKKNGITAIICIKNLFLLTDKPMIYVANVDDHSIDTDQISKAKQIATNNLSSFVTINGKLESEMADFDEEEKIIILEDYNLKETGLSTLIKEAYNTLGLQTFFTCGEMEVRGWTINKGECAVDAAAEIHTDFATKFIKAEIYTFDDAIKHQDNIKELKTLGLVKNVGRDYIMQEGDVAYFIKGQ